MATEPSAAPPSNSLNTRTMRSTETASSLVKLLIGVQIVKVLRRVCACFVVGFLSLGFVRTPRCLCVLLLDVGTGHHFYTKAVAHTYQKLLSPVGTERFPSKTAHITHVHMWTVNFELWTGHFDRRQNTDCAKECEWVYERCAGDGCQGMMAGIRRAAISRTSPLHTCIRLLPDDGGTRQTINRPTTTSRTRLICEIYIVAARRVGAPERKL